MRRSCQRVPYRGSAGQAATYWMAPLHRVLFFAHLPRRAAAAHRRTRMPELQSGAPCLSVVCLPACLAHDLQFLTSIRLTGRYKQPPRIRKTPSHVSLNCGDSRPLLSFVSLALRCMCGSILKCMIRFLFVFLCFESDALYDSRIIAGLFAHLWCYPLQLVCTLQSTKEQSSICCIMTRHTTRLLHSGTVPAPALVLLFTLLLAQPIFSGPVSDCLASASDCWQPPPPWGKPLVGQLRPAALCLHSRKHYLDTRSGWTTISDIG
ncbi:hypothetical protein HDV62DRAFT_32021 [Trichoderma sp. SZMC 28011]